MDIKWKQQHINNACVPACLAMLLSQYNIQKEDSEIIYESKQPYLIEFSKSQNSFNAGVLIQSSEVMNIVPNKYNLEMVHTEYDHFNHYFQKAKELIKINTAFLTSLAQDYIPTEGYKQNKNTNGHAVVVYKIENDEFYFLDPDGGINRKEKHDFGKIKDFVSYNIHKNEVQKILEARNKLILGYLINQNQIKSNIHNLLTASKQVFEKVSLISREQAFSLINTNDKISYNDFYDFIIRIVKPISLDLKNALLTIPNPTNQEQNLISKLEELFINTLSIQKLLKDNPDLMIRNHLENLLDMINKIKFVAVKVVTEEIQKCH